jgi:hypothetical protein
MRTGILFVGLAIAGLCVSACDQRSPTESRCADVHGTYDVAWTDSCGTSGHFKWTLQQQDCSFSTPIVADHGGVAGTIDGNVVSLTVTSGFVVCAFSLTGTAELQGNVLTGQVTGAVQGMGCCSPQTLSFRAVRE